MAKAPRYFRFKQGKGFTYRDEVGQLATGTVVDWIKALAIPPAWSKVEITYSERAKILATGDDAAGRKQYIYNPVYRAAREKAKFDRLLSFAEALPAMRRTTGQHLRKRKLSREKVLACMVRLIDQAYFRVGSERYLQENQTYGLTTLRSRHLRIEGERLIFEYVGKSHKLNHREVEDSRLARIVAELDELPGYEIFKYVGEDGQLIDVTSNDLNAYIKDIMGEEFSAKDFRTWAGTLIAAVALAELHANPQDAPLKKHIVEAVKTVAEHLGNTPSVAKASYIDPRVIDHYLGGTTIRAYLMNLDNLLVKSDTDLSQEEVAVIQLLQRRLRRKA